MFSEKKMGLDYNRFGSNEMIGMKIFDRQSIKILTAPCMHISSKFPNIILRSYFMRVKSVPFVL